MVFLASVNSLHNSPSGFSSQKDSKVDSSARGYKKSTYKFNLIFELTILKYFSLLSTKLYKDFIKLHDINIMPVLISTNPFLSKAPSSFRVSTLFFCKHFLT